MSEKFPRMSESLAPEKNSEQMRAQEMLTDTEKQLEQIETTRAVMIANIGSLDEKIPHNDIIQDNTSLSYNVARNSMLSDLNDLDDLEHALQMHRDQLQSLLDIN